MYFPIKRDAVLLEMCFNESCMKQAIEIIKESHLKDAHVLLRKAAEFRYDHHRGVIDHTIAINYGVHLGVTLKVVSSDLDSSFLVEAEDDEQAFSKCETIEKAKDYQLSAVNYIAGCVVRCMIRHHLPEETLA